MSGFVFVLPVQGPPQHPLLCAKIRQFYALVDQGLNECPDADKLPRPKRVNMLTFMRIVLPHLERDIQTGDAQSAYIRMVCDFDAKSVKSAFFKQNNLLKLARPLVEDILLTVCELKNRTNQA